MFKSLYELKDNSYYICLPHIVIHIYNISRIIFTNIRVINIEEILDKKCLITFECDYYVTENLENN
jgi:hypothetical protein